MTDFQYERIHEHTMDGAYIREIGMIAEQYGLVGLKDRVKLAMKNLKGTQQPLKVYRSPVTWLDSHGKLKSKEEMSVEDPVRLSKKEVVKEEECRCLLVTPNYCSRLLDG